VIDEQGHIQSFSKAAERLFGHRADDMIGENIRRLMPSPYREVHDSYLARYRDTGERRIIGIGRSWWASARTAPRSPWSLRSAR